MAQVVSPTHTITTVDKHSGGGKKLCGYQAKYVCVSASVHVCICLFVCMYMCIYVSAYLCICICV